MAPLHAITEGVQPVTRVQLMATLTQQAVTLPTGWTVQPTLNITLEALYRCYTAGFGAGDLAYFFQQDADERRAYFNDLLSAEPPSLALLLRGSLVGFSAVLPSLWPNCHLSCLVIDAPYQGCGMGTVLLRLCMNAALDSGFQSMTLTTDNTSRVMALYARHGFRQVGDRSG